MTRDEALAIAYDRAPHATVSYDLAARVIRETGAGRDNEVYARLAETRASLQRELDKPGLSRWFDSALRAMKGEEEIMAAIRAVAEGIQSEEKAARG